MEVKTQGPQDPQILTVTALTKYIKYKFDQDPHLQKVTVIGELSGFNPRSLHKYITLKDEGAQIPAVIFQGIFKSINFQVENGRKYIATGRIEVYQPHGRYQLIIESLQPDQLGAYYLQLEQLKKKLQAAGAFDQRQAPIRRYPKRLAVITSPTGAVIRDILTTVKRRYPICQVTVFPAKVQGTGSVESIVQAFELVDQHWQKFDTLIVARGGGSLEDLWSFNDERVAQAILQAKLPVISSIGHETDVTIADFVADHRAPTPTAAAELATPVVLTEELVRLNQQKERIIFAMGQRLNQLKQHLTTYENSPYLKQPKRIYQPYLQELDLLRTRLGHQSMTYLQGQQQGLDQLVYRLKMQVPTHRIKQGQQLQENLETRLYQAMTQELSKRRQDLTKTVALLDAYSPLQIMQRGYAILEQDGHSVHNVQAVEEDQPLTIQLHDGQILAKVDQVIPNDSERTD